MIQNLPSAVDSYQVFSKFLVDFELTCKLQSSQISPLDPTFSHSNRGKAPQPIFKSIVLRVFTVRLCPFDLRKPSSGRLYA
jgi:hypothetical protein